MPTRHNDALDAYVTVYMPIVSEEVNRNGTVFTDAVLAQLTEMLNNAPVTIFPSSMFEQASVSFEIAQEEPDDTVLEHSEELDSFLKEFALKEVC